MPHLSELNHTPAVRDLEPVIPQNKYVLIIKKPGKAAQTGNSKEKYRISQQHAFRAVQDKEKQLHEINSEQSPLIFALQQEDLLFEVPIIPINFWFLLIFHIFSLNLH